MFWGAPRHNTSRCAAVKDCCSCCVDPRRWECKRTQLFTLQCLHNKNKLWRALRRGSSEENKHVKKRKDRKEKGASSSSMKPLGMRFHQLLFFFWGGKFWKMNSAEKWTIIKTAVGLWLLATVKNCEVSFLSDLEDKNRENQWLIYYVQCLMKSLCCVWVKCCQKEVYWGTFFFCLRHDVTISLILWLLVLCYWSSA